MTRARYVSNPQAIDIPLTVSANLTANAVITVGNSSVNSVITSNTYSVGSNVSLSTSRLFLGNSTVNSVHTASTLDVGANVNLSTVGLNVGSNTVNAYINSTSFAIGNSTVNTAITSTTITSTALLSIGNTNVTGTANVSTAINVGANVNLGTSFMDVGNSTVNTTITNITVSTNTVNVASIINVGANVNLSTSQINVGNATVNTTISATALTTTSNTVSIGTAAYFVANGNVGIGTNSPTVKLQINQSSSTVGLRILSTNATSQNTLQMFHDDSKAVIEASYLASGAFKDIVMQSQGGNLLVNGTSQSGTANKVAVFSANKFGLSIIDTTAQANGVGGALNLGGNYRTSGDAQAFARIAAVKENSTDANYAYGMAFSTTPNGGSFVEAARIDSNGNLGIGTTVPNARLDVRGDTGSTVSAIMRIRGTNTTSRTTRLQLEDYTGTLADATIDFKIPTLGSAASALLQMGINGAAALVIDGSSNVLVGGATSTRSSAKLDVFGETIALGGNATYFGTIGYNAGTGLLSLAAEGGGHIRFLSGATALGRMTATGDLLLNETSKNASWGKQVLISDTDYPAFILKATRATNGRQYIVGLDGTGGGQSYLSFHDHTAGATRMVIDYSGCVGIGVTTPITFAKLAIRSAVTATIGTTSTTGVAFSCSDAVTSTFYISHNNAAVNLHADNNFCFYGPNAGPNVERMRIDTSGNFFINKTSVSVGNGFSYLPNMYGTGVGLLDLRGNSTSANDTIIQAYRTANSTYAFFVQWSGQIYSTSTSILSTSDESLKQNIRSLETGLSEIMALQPRRFDWIDGRAQNVAGFVAQEVQPFLPDLIERAKHQENEDGTSEYKLSIRMSDMIPTMVKAIQEQQALIAQLQADVAELKQQ